MDIVMLTGRISILSVFIIGIIIFYRMSFSVKDLVHEVNDRLKPPVNLSSDIRLDLISYSGHQILFKYTFLKTDISNLPDELEDTLQTTGQKHFCDNVTKKDISLLSKENVMIKLNYYNNEDLLLSSLSIDPNQC